MARARECRCSRTRSRVRRSPDERTPRLGLLDGVIDRGHAVGGYIPLPRPVSRAAQTRAAASAWGSRSKREREGLAVGDGGGGRQYACITGRGRRGGLRPAGSEGLAARAAEHACRPLPPVFDFLVQGGIRSGRRAVLR